MKIYNFKLIQEEKLSFHQLISPHESLSAEYLYHRVTLFNVLEPLAVISYGDVIIVVLIGSTNVSAEQLKIVPFQYDMFRQLTIVKLNMEPFHQDIFCQFERL